MLNIKDRIPPQYFAEFIKDHILFIKSRIRLLCALSIGLYFFASLIGTILQSEEFMPLEILLGIVLVIGGMLLLYINQKTKTYAGARLCAYLFTAFLLTLIVRLGVDYSESAIVSTAVFMFTLFLVIMTIPWRPVEIVLVWAMHLIAFSTEFLLLKSAESSSAVMYDLSHYLDGAIFLTMAAVLCMIVRKKDIIRVIDNFVLLKKVQEKNDQVDRELQWATRVHKTIISPSTSNEEIEMAVSYLPVYYIGGDYVKYEFLDKEKVIFIISDVTGHGVSAALLVNRVHAEFERLAKEEKDPGVLLKELNNFIKEDFEGSDMFLSAFCGLLDFYKMKMLYSNYGHPTQYLYSKSESKVIGMPSQATLLGVPMDDDKVHQKSVKFDKGDKILLFTDGVTEANNSKGEEFGKTRVERFLGKNHAFPGEEFNHKLLHELNTYKDGKFKDDVCLLSIDIKVSHPVFSAMGNIFGTNKT
ncbi:MAG: SpoIIE family protein phosphatase [Candidatus Tantalella remota]|nr:SpoIIE family protein phosphatase [Candidatus Tantalella remota]